MQQSLGTSALFLSYVLVYYNIRYIIDQQKQNAYAGAKRLRLRSLLHGGVLTYRTTGDEAPAHAPARR
jgi:hypothetical protein